LVLLCFLCCIVFFTIVFQYRLRLGVPYYDLTILYREDSPYFRQGGNGFVYYICYCRVNIYDD